MRSQIDAPNPALPSAVTFSSWILLDGDAPEKKAACLDLVQELKMRPQVFHLRLHSLVSWLPTSFYKLAFFRSKEEGPLTPPWPDFVLSTGRLGSIAASLIKQRAPKRTFTVCLNTPKVQPSLFDVIISTADDPLVGENVLTTTGGFSSLTPERLKKAAHLWWERLNFLPQPWISVLIGAPFPKTRFSQQMIESFMAHLKALAHQTGGGLMVYCCPDLPSSLIKNIEAALSPYPHFLWKGEGDNPYEAFLGMADYLLAPADSHALLIDLLATDKPIYLCPALSSTFHNQNFVNHLYETGLARPFKGTLDFWSRSFFSETQSVAEALLTRLMTRF